MDPLSDEKIIDSWHKNATPWTAAVREQRIESRKLVTDHAIVDAVMSRRPDSVLDIGCGEGWLVRALAARGVRESSASTSSRRSSSRRARAGGGEFRVASYEEIARRRARSHRRRRRRELRADRQGSRRRPGPAHASTCSTPAARSSSRRCIRSSPPATCHIRTAGAPARGPDSATTSPIRLRGTSARSRLGSS